MSEPEILIEVTRDDIDEGVPGLEEKCPLALAVKRALGISVPDQVSVSDEGIEVWRGETRTLYPYTEDSLCFIYDFDRIGRLCDDDDDDDGEYLTKDDLHPFSFPLGDPIEVEVDDEG